jgi:hypothetical protein
MDCRKCHSDLTAYLDEELPGSEAVEMERHLEKCALCRQECEELRAAMHMITVHVHEIDPAPETWHQLRARLVEMPPPTGSFGLFRFLILYRWVTAVGTVAATLLLAVGIWGFIDYRHSQSELQSYMNDYMQMRNINERLHILAVTEPASPIESTGAFTLENPFTEMRPVALTNPFRVEER